MTFHDDPFDGDTDDEPSRSQRKREAHALKQLGMRLLELNDTQLAQLALPDALAEALALAKRITEHEGRRRQLQYVGKLMRRHDVSQIAAFFDEVDRQNALEKQRVQQIDAQLAQLLDRTQSTRVLGALFDQFPALDRQKWRQLCRSAQREIAMQPPVPPKFTRQLRRWLRDLPAAVVLPSSATESTQHDES